MEKTLIWLAANWLPLIKVILVFGVLIIAHEFGHFIAAKKIGVGVHEFSFGMGPKLLSWKRGETVYAWRLFPIGGFVAIEGEDTKTDDKSNLKNIQNRTVLERFIIVVAGCVTNYLLAVVLFFVLALSFGVVKVPLIVDKVLPNTPAYEVGIKPGDEIIAVNNEYMNSDEIVGYLNKHPNEEVSLKIIRGKKELNIRTKIMYDKEHKVGRIGIASGMGAVDFYFKRATLGEALAFSAERTYGIIMMPYYVIKAITSKKVTGKELVKTAAGPIGIGQIIFVIAKKGFPSLLYFTAVLNGLIGFFNLLPLPALDGGRIVFLAIEAVRGKPIDQELEGKIHWVGLILLLCLAALVSYQDILRLIHGTPLIK